METCIFCKIIKGDIPSYKIYEDDYCLCFLDINPVNNGHTLIIPKKHYLDINDISLEELNNINNAVKKVYYLLNSKLNPNGIKIVQNNGTLQEVKHYHTHIIPYFDNETLKDVKDIYDLLTN